MTKYEIIKQEIKEQIKREQFANAESGNQIRE